MNITDLLSLIRLQDQMKMWEGLSKDKAVGIESEGLKSAFYLLFQNLLSQYQDPAQTLATNPSKDNKVPPVWRVPKESHSSFDPIIKEAAEKYQVPVGLIKSVIQAESSFNPHAVSKAGAQGLMQLMPATARGLGVRDALNPVENIEGGTKYLRQLLDRYNGDLTKTLAAYNAGPGNVAKYGGIPPFKETQNYVKKVMANYNIDFNA